MMTMTVLVTILMTILIIILMMVLLVVVLFCCFMAILFTVEYGTCPGCCGRGFVWGTLHGMLLRIANVACLEPLRHSPIQTWNTIGVGSLRLDMSPILSPSVPRWVPARRFGCYIGITKSSIQADWLMNKNQTPKFVSMNKNSTYDIWYVYRCVYIMVYVYKCGFV